MKTLKTMSKEELVKEVSKLRRAFTKYSYLTDWDSMARHYHSSVAEVNLGERPNEPSKWW